jgi:hypothetical protein
MTSEKKAVERFGDAQVGDWVWHYDSQASVYDPETKKYLGRGKYELVQVTGRTKQSLIIGRDAKYKLEDGRSRTVNGYNSNNRLLGEQDKHDVWWEGRRYDLGRLVQDCKDIEKLKSVAFILGFERKPGGCSL